MNIRFGFVSMVMVAIATGCSFGVNTCTIASDCSGSGVCIDGVCVIDDDAGAGGGAGGGGAAGGGSMNGGGTGMGGGAGGGGAVGGGGAGGDAGRDAGLAYCDAGLGCTVVEECVASAGGGACVDAQLELRWSSPDSGVLTNASTVAGGLVVTKQDGGVVPSGLVPQVEAPSGASASVSGVASPFGVTLGLAPGDGAQTFQARLVDGGVAVPLVVNVDKTGPAFTIQALADAGYGATTADFIPTDLALPAAYRKDEVVTVQVTTPATDVASVKLVARFAAGPRFEVTTSTPCTAVGLRCDSFQLDLSQVSMAGFNGQVRLTVEGADALGNAGAEVMSRDVSVTRWQWARRVTTTQSIRSTPALGAGGRVFVATTLAAAGVIEALNPDGSVAWGPLATGPVDGAVAVGRGASGEWLFYAVNSGVSGTAATATGVASQTCFAGSALATTVGGVALLGDGTANVGSISLQPGPSNGNRAMQNNVSAASCRDSLTEGLTGIQTPGNIVVGGGNAYYVNGDGNLRRLGVAPGATPIAGTLNQSVGGIGITNGLILLSGTRVVGGGGPGIGKLFAFEVTGDTAAQLWGSATPLSSPTSGPSVGALGLFAQYRVSGRSVLLRVNAGDGIVSAQSASLGDATTMSSFTGTGAPTPALGADGRVYLTDDRGSLFVLPQGFVGGANAQWAAALPAAVTAAGPVVSASPTLDCNRRKPSSETGVLYIATEAGWLVSYLVDAKGLDATAPWPKYARDARNTGNFQGPPVACP